VQLREIHASSRSPSLSLHDKVTPSASPWTRARLGLAALRRPGPRHQAGAGAGQTWRGGGWGQLRGGSRGWSTAGALSRQAPPAALGPLAAQAPLHANTHTRLPSSSTEHPRRDGHIAGIQQQQHSGPRAPPRPAPPPPPLPARPWLTSWAGRAGGARGAGLTARRRVHTSSGGVAVPRRGPGQ